MVNLAEDLYLLACHETTGRVRIPAAHLDLGLGGALLLDLVLHKRVALVDGRVAVTDSTPTGDPLLDAALVGIAAHDASREPSYWVQHLSRGARAAVQDWLVATGVLRVEDHKVLGFIHVHHAHQADGRIEHELTDRLYDAVVLGHPASAETAALVSLALAVGLERLLLRRAVQRAQQISGADWVGAEVRHAVDALDAALGMPGPSPATTDETG